MIPITPDTTIFFLHIPKTAGSSLRLWLETHFDQDQICGIYGIHELCEIDDPAAYFNRFRLIRAHFGYSMLRQFLDHDPITLTVLRDPIDRFISQWGYLRAYPINIFTPPERRQILEQVRTLSLAEFADAIATDTQLSVQWQTTMIGSLNTHYSSVQPSQRSPTPDQFQLAQQRLQQFAWVGLTERFAESLALLAYTFGWWPPHHIPRYNVTAQRPRVAEISPQLREQISAITRIDQQLYAIGSELFAQRYQAMCTDLLERFGRRDHARLETPLTLDTLIPLLERHYIACLPQRGSRPVQGATLFEHGFEGDGWYEVEYSAQGKAYRWSGINRHAQIILPVIPATGYRVVICVVHAIAIDTLHTLQIRVNHHILPHTVEADARGEHSLVLQVPASLVPADRPLIQLQLVLPQVYSIETDHRTLGIAVHSVTIEPTETAGPEDMIA
ncbi:MAG TPA: sulfotransferase family 2 domain-containing protein [Roseiflexaceae bacterium]|nr:sulfotransferase family 2 domain-containing protein [Roseiflexaceae bacterium]